jgi:hypothetical protein
VCVCVGVGVGVGVEVGVGVDTLSGSHDGALVPVAAASSAATV